MRRTLVFGLVMTFLVGGGSAWAQNGGFQQYEKSGESYARGLAAAQRGKTEAARTHFDRAVQLDGEFIEAMVNLARLHFEAGEIQKATQWLDRAATIRTDYPELHKVRALIALEEERPHDAIVFLMRARKLAPEDVEVLVNLGAAYLELGVLDEAQGVLKQSLRLEPSCAPCLLNLGLVADHRGEFTRGRFLYQRFLGVVGNDHPDRQAVLERLELLEAGK